MRPRNIPDFDKLQTIIAALPPGDADLEAAKAKVNEIDPQYASHERIKTLVIDLLIQALKQTNDRLNRLESM